MLLADEDMLELEAIAARNSTTPVEVVRAWIATGNPVEPIDFARARPRAGVMPHLTSRWTPRHVWTLHLVPGRREGPPLAVRRRVLEDSESLGCYIETPAGRMGFDLDQLSVAGHTRGDGAHKWVEKADEPPLAGQFWGCELCLDVWDHSPSPAERARWLQARQLEQALVSKPPRRVWVTFAGSSHGSADRAVCCRARRALGNTQGDITRADLKIELPGYVRPIPNGMILHEAVVSIYELARKGKVIVRARVDGARHVYLRAPTHAQLVEDGQRWTD